MSSYRITVLVLSVVLLGTIGGYLLVQHRAAPQLTLNSRSGEVTPSAEFLNVRAAVDHYRAQILRHPDVVDNYAHLAQLFLQEARASGDETSYVPQAERLLNEALERDPNHYHALVLKAALLNKLHRFEDARDLAHRLIERNDHHAFTYGVLVDALVELGAYEDAIRAADRAVAIRPDLASYARISYLRELHGDTEGAIAAMTRAANAGMLGREDRAWALYNLGQLYLNEGRTDTAAFIFDGLLEERPGYGYAYGGLAQVALVEENYGEAIHLFNTAYAASPNAGFLEGLAEAYTASGDLARADSIDRHILKAFADEEAIGSNVNMELADFYADRNLHLEEALERAQREIERRPDHLHALETYAWTLHKNGRSDEAVPYIQRAMRLESEDAMVDFRAGMIYRGTGDTAAAVRHFQLALDRGLHIESGTAADEADAALAALLAERPHNPLPVQHTTFDD